MARETPAKSPRGAMIGMARVACPEEEGTRNASGMFTRYITTANAPAGSPVTTIMNNASITDTVLHFLEGAVSGLNSGVFAVVMYLVNIPLAFLVPSSSGHATLAMPIMAPLGDFAGVSRAMVVTAYQSASGWMNLFTPTSAIVMGGLALSRVGYNRFLRFVAPLLLVLLILTCLFMLLGVAVPALGGSVT